MYAGDKPLYPQAPQAMYSPPGMPPGIPQSFPGKDFPVPQGQLGMPFPAASMEPMGQPPPPFKEQPVPEAQVYDEPEMQAKPGLFTNERGNLKVRTFRKSSISLWSAGTRSVTRVGARRRASAGTRVARNDLQDARPRNERRRNVRRSGAPGQRTCAFWRSWSAGARSV